MQGQDHGPRLEQPITFVPELMANVEKVLAQYELANGPLRNTLERGLVISYLLGIMSCELEAIWDAIGSSPEFGSLHPRVVFEECTSAESPLALARRSTILAELRKREWLR